MTINIKISSSPDDKNAHSLTFVSESDKHDKRIQDTYLSVATLKTDETYTILVGLGDASQGDMTDRLAAAVATGCRRAQDLGLTAIAIDMPDLDAIKAKRSGQAIVMGLYAFTTYKSDVPKPSLETISVIAPDHLKSAFDAGIAIGHGVNRARDLANTPANDLTPSLFIEAITAEFENSPDFSLEIIDEKTAKARGMNCLTAVGQGSPEPSSIAVIYYNGNKKSDDSVAIVGKGITFDTGGISIKPAGNMKEMKGDMSGAAAVFGSMTVLKALKPAVNVYGVIALAENMPSGTAQRPGDVIRAYNGTTVEIVNTDAEGRLVLADALAYIATKKPELIVDIATLTGAAMVALGREAMAIMTNSPDDIKLLKDTQAETGERVWELPLYDSFKSYLKSDIADIAHCSEGRWGGTCTAAKFLEQFVDNRPWIHIDMAPQMTNTKTKGEDIKGMSGAGVRSLVALIMKKLA